MNFGLELAPFEHLGLSLGIGLLIGLERGWETRAMADGQRVAGLRTYGLVGLLGGCTALAAGKDGTLLLGLGTLAVTILFAVAYLDRKSVV